MTLFGVHVRRGSRRERVGREAATAEELVHQLRRDDPDATPALISRLVTRTAVPPDHLVWRTSPHAPDQPVRRFRPLHIFTNEPPPTTLTGTAIGRLFTDLNPGLGRFTNSALAERFHAALRAGRLPGRSSLLRGARVETAPLLELVGQTLAEELLQRVAPAPAGHTGGAPLLETDAEHAVLTDALVAFRGLQLVELPDRYTPPEEVTRPLTPTMARYLTEHAMVPIAFEPSGALVAAARDPLALHLGPELSRLCGHAIQLVRCANTPSDHGRRVTRVLEQIGVFEPSAAFHWSTEYVADFRLEPIVPTISREQWLCGDQLLPPLPELGTELVRYRGVLSHGLPFVLELEAAPGSMLWRNQQQLVHAFDVARWCGLPALTLIHDRLHGCVELHHADRPGALLSLFWREFNEVAVPLVALAVGIDPAVLPPAEGRVEVHVAGVGYTLTGRTRHTAAGEQITLRWSPMD